MKKIFSIFLAVFISACSQAQVSEFRDIDSKMAFQGIPFLSSPDYSKLKFKNRTSRGINVYNHMGGVEFKTGSFTLSEIYVSVQKGRLTNFLLPLKPTEYEIMNRVLTEAFDKPTEIGDNKTFFGVNILFTLLKGNNTYHLFMATDKTDTIPDIKDQNGIIDLLGKKDTDPEVLKLIASIPGKKEKKEYSTGGYGYTWPGEGIVIEFNGKEGESVLNDIIIYFMKDSYYWKNKPYKGAIKLPYDITANTSLLQLRDMFGDEDSEFGSTWRTKNYKKFKVYCNFGDPVKQTNSALLNHITIK